MGKEAAVICINDKNRPADFPKHLWIEQETEIYHVVSTHRSLRQPHILGYVLKEKDLSGLKNYDSFQATRFRPATEEDRLNILAMEELLDEMFEEELVML